MTSESNWTAPALTRRRAIGIAGGFLAGTALGRSRQAAAQDQEIAPRSESDYFAETGHNLDEPFLTAWLLGGGQDVLGPPISEERYADGVGVAQSFEGLTLVFDPGLPPPWDVQAQHLPESYRTEVAPASALKRVTNCPSNGELCQYFPETGHTLSGRIGSFWSVSGDLALFGMPVSEPFRDGATDVTVQVFERAVLEDHGSKDVRVRPVARQLAEASGLTSDPAFLPAPPSAGESWLVRSAEGLRLREGPSLDADVQVVLPDNAEFIAAPGQSGDWAPGYADGFAGWVSASFLTSPPPAPILSTADWDPSVWQGIALGESNVRSGPTTSAQISSMLNYGDQVTVSAWVRGEEVFTGADMWAQIGDSAYVYSRNVGRNAPLMPASVPPESPSQGKWIDVNLTQQVMVAYEGRNPARVTLTTTGMAGWETPPGYYQILVRVPNETMTSGAIGAEHFYKLEDVLYTQYFSDRGHAIHYAWWRTPQTIGRPGSHGCLNLLLDDSRFFWNWAEIGTPVIVHK